MGIWKEAKTKAQAFMESKRGAMSLGDVPSIFLSLVFIVTIGVAVYLVLAGLSSSTTNQAATSAVQNFTLSMNNVIAYAPTWGTIIGVAVLIGIVVTAFAYSRQNSGL